MAKKKHLNKRVVVFLVIIGMAIVAVLMAKLWPKIFPKDPAAQLEQAEALAEAENWTEAEEAYDEALKEAKKADSSAYPVHQYSLDMAEFLRRRINEDKSLTMRDRSDRLRYSIQLARDALRKEENYLPAQEFLCDVMWQIAVTNRQWETYIDEADNMLRINPDDAKTYYRRGFCEAQLRSLGRSHMEQALKDLAKACQLDPDNEAYWGFRAGLLAEDGKADQAEAVYRTAIQKNPKNGRLRLALAEMLYRADRKDEALAELNEALSESPDDAAVYVALARHWQREKDVAKAREALAKALEIEPTNADAYMNMMRLDLAEGNLDQAIDRLTQGVKALEGEMAAMPADAPQQERVQLRGRLDRLRVELASRFLDNIRNVEDAQKQELIGQARAVLAELDHLGADNPYYLKLAGRIALAEGDAREAFAKLEAAHGKFRAAGRLDLQVADLLVALHRQRREPLKALELLGQMRNVGGQEDNIRILLAQIEMNLQMRRYGEARQLVSAAMDIDPDNEKLREYQAQVAALSGDSFVLPEGQLSDQTVAAYMLQIANTWNEGDRDLALARIEQLHKRAPGNLRVLALVTQLARVSEDDQKLQAALARAREALKDDPDKLHRVSIMAEQDKDKRLALQLEMAETAGTPLEVHIQKANAYRIYGKQEEYIKHLAEAEKIDPDADWVIENRFMEAVRSKDWEAAEKLVVRAAEANVDKANGDWLRSQLAYSRKDYDQAIDRMEKILSERPELKQVRTMLGMAYLQKEDFDQAKAHFTRVLDADPSFPQAVVGMLRVATATSDEDARQKYALQGHQLAPSDPFVRREYLRARELANANPEEIIRQRTVLTRTNPDDLDNRNRLAMLFERVGQYDKAQEQYNEMYKRDQNKLRSGRLLMSFYARRGSGAGIEAVAQQLLKETDDKVGAYTSFGQAMVAVNPRQAKGALDKAIELGPEDPRSHLAMSSFYSQTRQPGKAAESLEQYMTLSGERAGSQKRLIRLLMMDEQFNRAERLVDAILAKDPADKVALTLKGRIRIAQNRLDAAQRLLDQASRIDPRYAEPLEVRATLNLMQGDLDQARNDLRTAWEISRMPEVGLRAVSINESLNANREAVTLLQEIIRESPMFLPAYLRLARLHQQQQDWPELETLLINARRRFPTSEAVLLQEAAMWKARRDLPRHIKALAMARNIAPDRPDILRSYLVALVEAKQHDQVTKVVQQYENQPGFADWIPAISARSKAMNNQNPAAVQQFKKAFAGSVDKPDALSFVTEQLVATYGHNQTIKLLESWLPEVKDHWLAHRFIGGVCREAGQLNAAIEHFQNGLKVADAPGAKADLHRLLGVTYHSTESVAQAEEHYRQALKIAPSDAVASNNLAYLLVTDKNDPKSALPFAEQAVRNRPGDGNTVDTLGWTYFALKDYNRAETTLMRALQLNQGSAVIRYHLGRVYEATDRASQARRQYEAAWEIVRADKNSPVHEDVRQALERTQ